MIVPGRLHKLPGRRGQVEVACVRVNQVGFPDRDLVFQIFPVDVQIVDIATIFLRHPGKHLADQPRTQILGILALPAQPDFVQISFLSSQIDDMIAEGVQGAAVDLALYARRFQLRNDIPHRGIVEGGGQDLLCRHHPAFDQVFDPLHHAGGLAGAGHRKHQRRAGGMLHDRHLLVG